MKFLLILVTALLCGLAVGEEPVRHRPANEAYLEPELNISFPADAGEFRKQEVVRSLNPLIGTTIHYINPDGDCADIYIYSLPDVEKEISSSVAEAHFQSAKQAILTLPARKEITLKKTELVRERPLRIVSSGQTVFANGFSAEFRFVWADKTEQYSLLQIIPYKEKIIKLRITCKKEAAGGFSAEILYHLTKK